MISSSQRPLPDNTQHSQQTNIHAPSGIRTHDLSRRAAADLRLKPRCHWDRPLTLLLWCNIRDRTEYSDKQLYDDVSEEHILCPTDGSSLYSRNVNNYLHNFFLDSWFRASWFNVNKKVQLDATVSRHLFPAKSLYMFRASQHPSSGVLKTVTATSAIGHNTGTATSFQRGLFRTSPVTPETCRVTLQWINVCLLLHQVGSFY